MSARRIRGSTPLNRVPEPRQAVFFDRDGTLNVDDGAGYTHKAEDLRWLPGAMEAIRACNQRGALAIVVTNQSGIARGLYDAEALARFHAAMQADLAAQGARIDAYYFCPFHDEAAIEAYRRADHPDRKPNPGMIRRAILEWGIDAASSLMVGDRDVDVAAAAAAGVKGVKAAPGELEKIVTEHLAQTSAADAHTIQAFADLKDRAAQARRWLFDHALPIWWERGFDRTNLTFEERLGLDGRPAPVQRRVRVQARQTFVYVEAGRLGWSGPWQDAAAAGADVLLTRCLCFEGGAAHLLDPSGAPIDRRRDLYDAAFVIFALAHAGGALDMPLYTDAANQLADWVHEEWAHPKGGFREGEVTPTPPRRQNPHMHLLEALIALHDATRDARRLEQATAIANLAATRFVSPEHKALLEYFDDDWRPADGEAGRIVEPGHQFEWAWLFDRLRRAGGPDHGEIADQLRVHGEVYGVNPATGATYDEVWVDGGVRAATSRLWPHTERIKAHVVNVEMRRDANSAAAAVQAFDVLMRYCDVPLRGLWRDRLTAEGAFVEEPAPASSFYHIMVALSELIRVADQL